MDLPDIMTDFVAIKGYETYGINKNGEVIDYRSGKIKPQFLNGCGYNSLVLRNPEGATTVRTHRLVALTFVPNPDNLPEVDHIDRNRTNNSVENLRWVDDYEQSMNRCGFGKYEKYIRLEKPCGPKNPYSCWVFQVYCKKLRIKKRFRTDKYSLEDVINFKKNILEQHGIPYIK